MVMIDINVYKTKNSMYWLFLYLSMNIDAIYLKKPASSSEIDIKDMEMNNTNIFNGFNSLLDIKLLKYAFWSNPGKHINKIAARRSGIKNVSRVTFFILNTGNFNMHTNISIMALMEIIIVCIIFITEKDYIPKG